MALQEEVTREKVRVKADQAQALKELQTNEAFQYLKTVIEKRRDAVVTSLASSILAGGEIDRLRIAKLQGFYEGAMHVLNHPDNVERDFLKALKRLEDRETHE